jgi:hypothetical protein
MTTPGCTSITFAGRGALFWGCTGASSFAPMSFRVMTKPKAKMANPAKNRINN